MSTAGFWAGVDQSGGPDACHPWTRSRNGQGYGRVKFGGKVRRAHRVAYELTHGQIPDGLDVLHSCPGGDNPACCNPSHLRPGTDTDNASDRGIRGRTAKGDRNGSRTHPEARPRGERVGSKLTAEKVVAIRAAYARGGVSAQDLADSFGSKKTTIVGILARKVWKHVA